ncbi:hypothetical protein BUALT_Bualt11G0135200 [Buddleja alternifolia]|uniref:Uncharacterized protein n=1 Tax=Buddleja alternifolia TaxID=168488 RepID=A0AAV6X1Z7_9LAMI|nr:hypothetical protein BUALT_Bualt11G0135200 [Buddleja alternifolia]
MKNTYCEGLGWHLSSSRLLRLFVWSVDTDEAKYFKYSSSSFFSTRRKNDDEAVGRKRRIRRRSHTRRKAAPLTSSNFINMAEARKQIVNALHLHRSSSSSAKSITNNVPAIVSSSNDDPHQYYYYHHQLTDSMPIPEPTWSTTAPAVLCAPVPTMEMLEIDQWFDNLLSSSSSSSYSWWMGFLNSLDDKNNNANASSEVRLGQYHCNLDAKNHPYSSPNSDDQCLVPTDEWLVFPAAEEGGTGQQLQR